MADLIRVLLVDDEDAFCRVLSARLERQGFAVTAVGSGEQALRALGEQEFDVALFDLALPGMDGMELLQRAKETSPELEVVMLTGHGSIESAIHATRAGAYDYLTKPSTVAKLELTLRKAAEKKWLAERAASLSVALRRQSGNEPIIGQSAAMRQVTDLIRRVADGDAPVLITGESGTGKELVARSLHFWSRRRDRPFQALNSAALPPQLLESELFGHVRGAFTGAVTAKPGLVESADQGTLFLDEIGEVDTAVQAKLLRFLETGEFRSVGEVRTRTVKVRVVGATNRDLEQEVRAGRFREDLYYRLNVVRIHIPPLRERPEDVPLLAAYLLKSRSAGREPKAFTPESVEALRQHHFPGNVRELANMIERGILLAPGPFIEPRHLFGPVGRGQEPTAAPREDENLSLESMERRHIERVMALSEGNKTQAARLLGIGLRTLYRKLDEYKLDHAEMTRDVPN